MHAPSRSLVRPSGLTFLPLIGYGGISSLPVLTGTHLTETSLGSSWPTASDSIRRHRAASLRSPRGPHRT